MPEAAPLISEETRCRVLEYLEKHPSAMTVSVAQKLDVPEADVLRAQEGRKTWELRAEAFRDIMDELPELGRCHVFCSNRYAFMETFGAFGGYSVTGPFFNVQTDTLDMHIRYQGIAAVFCLDKPGHLDGEETHSIQFYAADGTAIFKVFLTRNAEGRYDPKHVGIYETIKRKHRRFP